MTPLLEISPLHYDCIVFDLDGTLLDTRADMISAVNRFLLRLDRPSVTAKALSASIHYGMPAMLGSGLAQTGGLPSEEEFEEMVQDFLSDYASNAVVHTQIYPESVELLQQLSESGFALAVCTNKQETITHRLLRHFKLSDFFGVVIGGDSLPACKPDPLPLRWIARRLGMRPSRIVLVGDSIIDVECACAAGAGLVLMEHGYGANDVTTVCTRMANFGALRAQMQQSLGPNLGKRF